MAWPNLRRTLLVALLVLSWVLSTALPALSITKAERDAACADSAAAQKKLDAARDDANAAEDRYDEINQELETASLRVYKFRDLIDEKSSLILDAQEQVQERAVELYMNGGSSTTGLILFAPSLDAALTGQEFLSSISKDSVATIDQLDSLKREMERIRQDWEAEQQRLEGLRVEADQVAQEMTAIMDDAATAASELSAACRAADLKYRQEQAAAAARAAARRNGAAAGLPPEATPGMICPMDPAVLHFRDTWGAPRSGGRTHKGTDIFAPMGQPQYAVYSGTVRVYVNHLGGNSIWLHTNMGVDFYYAHLSAWASGLKTGDTVKQGQIIGYNGNSGNAYGGAPHLHFQMHPGGGSPVNPYPTLKRVCG
jgi:murein DD-endopeptidase MepM/ murein hydrolase activator NlpD